ncbi:hypothetical protein MY04_0230 [Flammeovirga sp. MY04]|uniref:hypothetical protein n=1 Tax=Flammeovirga sp. MY04 TaxID=1191459 RepID=UPI0008062176|nr:hypothetical protein [Flammeovirga sp. MY04]ANQ47612.1 hypothetical protein MY04_0230 [Flammeovirga sp. MY04]
MNQKFTVHKKKKKETKEPAVYILAHEIMRGEGALPISYREIIAAYVSKKNNSELCFLTHVAICQELGYCGVLDIFTFDDKEFAPLFSFASKVMNESMSKEILNQFVQEGFEIEVAEEIIHIVSIITFINQLVNSNAFEKITNNQQSYIGHYAEMMKKYLFL